MRRSCSSSLYQEVFVMNHFSLYFCFILLSYACECFAQSSEYLCNGECGVVRKRCDCSTACEVTKNCCADYLQACHGEPEWVETPCSTEQELKCPDGFAEPPVILFSIDGFKAEYLYRDQTPNIYKLASCGVHAPYMRAVYPTLTFPSHYTIATGLYAENHGIISNSMYDHQHKEDFYLGSPNTFHPFWWGGEPVWVTASNQNKKSATYFWPGSDVNITRYPDYYFTYNGSIPNEERMYTALEWLDLTPDERPSLIVLYVSDVDHEGHVGGPDSDEVNGELPKIDNIISLLMNGLNVRGLENCVNLVLLADHGMAPQSCGRVSYIDQYGVDTSTVNFYGGALGRIGKSQSEALWDHFDPQDIVDKLKCQQESTHWLAYQKQDYFPKRYHYANHDRIEDVQLVVDDTWLAGEVKSEGMDFCDGGMHGYENEFQSMHALFAAHGPGFKSQYNTTQPFESIEIYNLLTDLLSLNPAPNNGTPGALHHVMAQPSNVPAPPPGVGLAMCSTTITPPSTSQLLGCKLCSGMNEQDANARLPVDLGQVSVLDSMNSLYGRPSIYLTSGELHCLIGQESFSNEFNLDRKQPVYVSYTLKDINRQLSSPVGCSRADYRIGNFQTNCSSYTSTDSVQPSFLYPPELSNGDAVYDALIQTNSVPMYPATTEIWRFLAKEQAKWANTFGGITVTSGPVFDYNYDGLPDTNETLTSMGKYLGDDVTGTPIPSHFFVVMTRCVVVGTPITQCTSSADDVEVLSFIIPNFEVYPCGGGGEARVWAPKILTQHVARVRDVELIAGLNFFNTWSNDQSQSTRRASVRAKVFLPQFTSDWLQDLGAMNSASRTSCCGIVVAWLLAAVWCFMMV